MDPLDVPGTRVTKGPTPDDVGVGVGEVGDRGWEEVKRPNSTLCETQRGWGKGSLKGRLIHLSFRRNWEVSRNKS